MLFHWYLAISGLILIFSAFWTGHKFRYNDKDGYIIFGYLCGGFIFVSGICIGCCNILADTPCILYILVPFYFIPAFPVIYLYIEDFKRYIEDKQYKRIEKKARKQKEEELKKQQRKEELSKLITNSKIKLYL